MSKNIPIGLRLREQREKLGYNQTNFAEHAGITRKTLFGYENGTRSPDAASLAAWEELGLDVLYVVVGQKNRTINNSNAKISHEEQELIDVFDEMTPSQQKALLELGKVIAQPEPNKQAG
ncbi:helix-turn-helix transcriptional regulator [Orbaceae bacterium ESL0727]|nr:helix-turn-helix transcriptional regulator [Orbaceae bacterium ESL0727]MDF7667982.1 helix-turn-helix transcriptional regulator [Orbaceae bacterium ESL0727]